MQFPERELLPSQIERETIKTIFKKSIFLVLNDINVPKDNELDSHRNAILAIDEKTHGRNRTVNKNDSLNLSQIVTVVLEFWRSRQNTADAFNLLHHTEAVTVSLGQIHTFACSFSDFRNVVSDSSDHISAFGRDSESLRF
jgi:hypothetical protein